MGDKLDDILNDFDNKQTLYLDFADYLSNLINHTLRDNNLFCQSVLSRLKNKESIARAYPAKNYKSLFNIHDIVGIRVTTYHEEEIQVVFDILEKYFSVNHPSQLEETHIMLKEPLQPNEEKFVGLKAEVQVVSMLQNVLNELNHNAIYKNVSGKTEMENSMKKIHKEVQKGLTKLEENLVRGNITIESDETMKKSLIWPIQTSLRIAEGTKLDTVGKLNNYFKLFELISIFNSILLVSALPKHVFEEQKEYLFLKEKKEFQAVSFGNWVGLYGRIASLYRELGKGLLNNLPFSDKKMYHYLSNKKIITSLAKVVSIRNDTLGHGGTIPDTIVRVYIQEVQNELQKILKTLYLAFRDKELIFPQSMTKKKGMYQIHVMKLEGNPFMEDILKSNSDLDTNVLYLTSKKEAHTIRFLEEFIKLAQCEHCGNWSLFFYNKMNSHKSTYISYHGEVHPLMDELDGVLLEI